MIIFFIILLYFKTLGEKREEGLKSIGDLFKLNFFIPSYQRGYRWKETQVEDLLEDIKSFYEDEKKVFIAYNPLL